jgi:hypothetical protein
MVFTSLDTNKTKLVGSPKTAAASFFGVCGVRNTSDYARLVKMAQYVLPDTGRFIMAGVKESISDPHELQATDLVRPFIHCDYSATEPYEALVFRKLALTESYIRGLQLNCLPWMEEDFTPIWKLIRRRSPHIKLMLQAHKEIMERYTPQQIADRLSTQGVDYIIFDASQSHGIPYDLDMMRAYIAAVYERQLPIKVVVAGGLGPETIQTLFKPLLTEYPGLSCDAFLRLQDASQENLSWPRVEQYLFNFLRLV